MNTYDLLRGLHIIAIVGWMAGMLMLPRLYAYQTAAAKGGELEQKMVEGAHRLRLIILTPAMVAAWIFGLWILVAYDLRMLGSAWLIAKLVLVTAMTGLHGYFLAQGRKLARGERPRSEKFWRLMNEVPFVLAILIILLATVEPNFPVPT